MLDAADLADGGAPLHTAREAGLRWGEAKAFRDGVELSAVARLQRDLDLKLREDERVEFGPRRRGDDELHAVLAGCGEQLHRRAWQAGDRLLSLAKARLRLVEEDDGVDAVTMLLVLEKREALDDHEPQDEARCWGERALDCAVERGLMQVIPPAGPALVEVGVHEARALQAVGCCFACG